MPSPSEPNEQTPYAYSFDDPQQAKRKRKHDEEDESLTEDVLDEIDERLGCSQRLLGWSVITWLPRLLWKIVSEIFD